MITDLTLVDYNQVIRNIWDKEYDTFENIIPTIIPNCDHTPRSGRNGTVYINSTPDNFERLAKKSS